MKTIALIQKNQCTFHKMEDFVLPLLYKNLTVDERKMLKNKINEYIWSIIEPYITFIQIDENDFITDIIENIIKNFPDKNPDDFFYHTETSYSFPKKFMEIIYYQPLWKEYIDAQIENMNNIGCLFSLKHTVIENSCVIISNNYDLNAPHFTKIGSIDKEDIIRVIRRRFFFTAILIKDNVLIKYYYQNPRYLITQVFGLLENDKIEKLAFTFLKYNLIFYFKQNKKDYINKIATRLNGSYQVYGDILVLHELEENIFANISIHEIMRLNVLSFGRLYDRQLKQEENYLLPITKIDENGKEFKEDMTPLWSRYIVIENRMLKWKKNKNKCINCDKEFINPIICQKCFRVKYCSKKCEQEFDSYHYKECINVIEIKN